LLYALLMNRSLAGLFASSLMILLPACSAPGESSSGAQPTPTSTVPTTPSGPPGVTASWKAAPGNRFEDLAVASAGDEAAVFYAESQTADSAATSPQTFLKLQRLDAHGLPRGEVVDLGVLVPYSLSSMTIASDGTRYLACWADDAQLDCAMVPVGEGSATSVLQQPGTSPAVAYGAGRWALARANAGQISMTWFTNDSLAFPAPVTFDAGAGPNGKQTSLLAANELGFVLVAGSTARVQQLDPSLAPLGAPVDLGADFWFSAAIATSGTKTTINLGKPYGSTTFFFDGAALLDSQEYGGGGKTGLRVALTAEGSSFGMLSGGDSDLPVGGPTGLLYRLIAPSAKPVVAAVLPDDQRSYDGSPIALVRLGGDTFVAATPAYSSGTEIIIVRAPQP
jgi:hypothetical protein